jgi:hypothetical protein
MQLAHFLPANFDRRRRRWHLRSSPSASTATVNTRLTRTASAVNEWNRAIAARFDLGRRGDPLGDWLVHLESVVGPI